MLMHPREGQRIQCWYKDRSMPHHGKLGTVVRAAAKGRGPRNHLVQTDDGTMAIVPAGNLNKAKE